VLSGLETVSAPEDLHVQYPPFPSAGIKLGPGGGCVCLKLNVESGALLSDRQWILQSRDEGVRRTAAGIAMFANQKNTLAQY
jgi:hypothetical protein